jgi:hypothetical protein
VPLGLLGATQCAGKQWGASKVEEEQVVRPSWLRCASSSEARLPGAPQGRARLARPPSCQPPCTQALCLRAPLCAQSRLSFLGPAPTTCKHIARHSLCSPRGTTGQPSAESAAGPQPRTPCSSRQKPSAWPGNQQGCQARAHSKPRLTKFGCEPGSFGGRAKRAETCSRHRGGYRTPF